MENTFMQGKKDNTFTWESLGDIKAGREDLGEEMPVLVYRLMQFTMLDVLTKAHGADTANSYFRQAGYLAGTEFAKNVLDLKTDFTGFVANLQEKLKNLKIGILRIEGINEETGALTLTVEQDLDCSGLPITGDHVCVYDEGFIAGILESYTGKKYNVYETDCWASGDKLCRFNGTCCK